MNLTVFTSKVYRYVKDRLPTPFHQAIKAWMAADGDQTLRFNYDLRENAVAFDIGGYKGWWTAGMLEHFPACTCYVFEPVKDFADQIQAHFKDACDESKVRVFNFGLGDTNSKFPISHSADGSSFFQVSEDCEMAACVSISDFIRDHSISKIDVMKVNIEGAEYGLIEELIRTDDIKKVQNLQVQFHKLSDKACNQRMQNIWKELEKTHRVTWSFRPYVWENWERLDHSED